MLARRFARCSQNVKITLFRAFCTSLYTCSLWANYTQKSIRALQVQYNNALRAVLGLPRYCSASGMFAWARTDCFHATVRKQSVRASPNTVLAMIANKEECPYIRHCCQKHVTSCETAGLARGAAPPLTLTVRNPAAVPLLLGAPALAAPALRAPPAPRACAAHGFRVTPCEPRELKENESLVYTVEFTTDWTLSRVSRALWLATSAGAVEVSLRGEVAPRLLAGCGGAGPAGGRGARAAGGRRGGAGRAGAGRRAAGRRGRAAPRARRPRPAPPRAARRSTCAASTITPPPRPPHPPPHRRRPPRGSASRRRRRSRSGSWTRRRRRCCASWRPRRRRRSGRGRGRGRAGGARGRDPSRSSTEEQEASPAATCDQSEAEEEPPAPAPPVPEPDDDAASATDSSHSDEPPAPPAPCTHEPRPRAPRPAPPRPADQPRLRPNKFHVKKEKSVKRRVAAAAPARPRRPPPRPRPPRRPPRCAARPRSARWWRARRLPRPPPPRPRALAPAGPHRLGAAARGRPSSAHSLFYFNGDVSEREAWEPPAFPRAPAAPPRTHNYTEDQPAEYTSPALGSSLWSTDSWSWSYAEVRPPPGFAPPAPPAAPPARAYDPFHALAAIWASDRPAWADPADEPRNNQQQQ
ncbi:unnamed protein product [Plutella xylostella]|uniref:(diamondback moth) hypothetical protein n=1 Tax=Plutella xylostella TaxID=51655 RepID=A0A8S4G242_PLUXY|nr:unnamed protein product [Plutella xylostella]